MFLIKLFQRKDSLSLTKMFMGFTVPIAISVLFFLRLRGGEEATCRWVNLGPHAGWEEGTGLEWRPEVGGKTSLSSDTSCVLGTPGRCKGTGNEQTLHTRCASGNRPIACLQLDIVFSLKFHFSH